MNPLVDGLYMEFGEGMSAGYIFIIQSLFHDPGNVVYRLCSLRTLTRSNIMSTE